MLLYFIRFFFIVTVIALLFVSLYVQPQNKPPDSDDLYRLAVRLEKEGNYEQAMENYRKAVEVQTTTSDDKARFSIGIAGLAIAVVVVLVEWFTPKKAFGALAGIFFGLLVGVLLSWAMSPVLEMINDLYFAIGPNSLKIAKWVMAVCICYLIISMVIQTKDDVRFVIPYVEFSRQTKGLRPLVLDTSVIIDGRIADIANTKFFDATLIVPRFVLNELQLVADSSDKMKRNRGRRGLDILNKLQTNPVVDIKIDDTPPPGVDPNTEVDQKLLAFSKNCDGRLVTNDYNLNKVAQLRGVDVININDLANALKTVTLPGETMEVKIIRPGEEPQQGIGYLEDGTMVVVEEARNRIGQFIVIAVTSSLQTSAGRMIFGKFVRPSGDVRELPEIPRDRRDKK